MTPPADTPVPDLDAVVREYLARYARVEVGDWKENASLERMSWRRFADVAREMLRRGERIAVLEKVMRDVYDNCGCYEDVDQCANCYRIDAALESPPCPTK